MASGSKVAVVLIAATVAAVLFTPFATTVADNSGTVTVTNESVTADLDNPVDLEGYRIVSGSETVWGFNDTSGNYEQLSAGTDYNLHEQNGSITFLSTSTVVQDGETAKVSYDYEATDQTTATIVDLLPLFVALLILATLATQIMNRM